MKNTQAEIQEAFHKVGLRCGKAKAAEIKQIIAANDLDVVDTVKLLADMTKDAKRQTVIDSDVNLLKKVLKNLK